MEARYDVSKVDKRAPQLGLTCVGRLSAVNYVVGRGDDHAACDRAVPGDDRCSFCTDHFRHARTDIGQSSIASFYQPAMIFRISTSTPPPAAIRAAMIRGSVECLDGSMRLTHP